MYLQSMHKCIISENLQKLNSALVFHSSVVFNFQSHLKYKRLHKQSSFHPICKTVLSILTKYKMNTLKHSISPGIIASPYTEQNRAAILLLLNLALTLPFPIYTQSELYDVGNIIHPRAENELNLFRKLIGYRG